MKFAYVAAALLGMAFANPMIAPDTQEDSLDLLDARDEDISLFDARDEDISLFDAFDELFSVIEERTADAEPGFDFEDEFDEEETELETRSAGSILRSLKSINAAIGGVNSALGKFGNNQKPSNAQALAVQRAGARLAQRVQAAIKTAKSSGKLGKGASKKVFNYVNGPLKGASIGSLQRFIDHAPGFKQGGFGGLVKKNLSKLKGLVGGLGNALLSKTKSKSIRNKGKQVLAQIQSKFNQAIGVY